MNEHEIARIAAAAHELRPDWPTSSVATLIRKNLANKPRRDVAVALAWVACEAGTANPGRVLENGPWWKAAGADDTSTHHHIAKVYGFTQGDPREVCSECSMHRHECQRRSATNGHTFRARTDVTWVPTEDAEPIDLTDTTQPTPAPTDERPADE